METLNREKMMEWLRQQGVVVVGTTEEFNGGEGGIWVSGEDTPVLMNYWEELYADTFGVNPSLNKGTEARGWYFEWYDAGTMMVWPS